MEIKTGLQQTQPTAGRLHSPGTQLALKLMECFNSFEHQLNLEGSSDLWPGHRFQMPLGQAGFQTAA